jgi:hypothetical protein
MSTVNSTGSRPSSRPTRNRPSQVPSRVPVRWVEGEELESESWHADWEGDDAGLELEALSGIGEAEEEVEEPDPFEQEPKDLADALAELDEEAAEAESDDEEEGDPTDESPEALEKRRGRRRSKTIARKQMLRERRRMLAQGLVPEILEYDRPVRRSECREAARPCLYVSCRYHLYLDVNPETGSIKLNFPDKEVWELAETCALDVAERGGITLEEVGDIMNLTRERIRQVEVSGLEKLRQGEVKLHTFLDGRELELDSSLPARRKRLPVVSDD